MARVQLALNVPSVDEAIVFYSRLFATEPDRVRRGYAALSIADPPLKLVLIEDPAKEPGSVNHLGIEVESEEDVAAAARRLGAAGLSVTHEGRVSCCYTLQDKAWVDGPGGRPWEIYVVLGEAETTGAEPRHTARSEQPCCATRPDLSATGPAPPPVLVTDKRPSSQ